MAERSARNKDSLQNLASGTTDDELFGSASASEFDDGGADDDEQAEQAPSSTPDEPDRPGSAAREIPSLKEVEPLFAQGRWADVCDLLGPPERAEELPPELGLLYATALKEHDPEGAPEANPVAIRSVAELLGVRPDSQTAVIVAKRILRLNPASWTSRSAPAATARVSIIILTVLIGAVVGWFLGPEGVGFGELVAAALR